MDTGESSRRCTTTAATSITVLPVEIVEEEILSRLTVKRLLRCKSVCKLWYSIIKNPNFISTHYPHRSNRNRNRPIFVDRLSSNIVHGSRKITCKPSYPQALPVPLLNDEEEYEDEDDKRGNNLLFKYYIGLPWKSIFVRPVNGFVLLLIADDLASRCRMAMLNPATRMFYRLCEFEFNTLSPPEEYLPLQQSLPIDNHMFGFGICKYSAVYKVVWLNIVPENRDKVVAKVYTVGDGGVGDGDWRMINNDLPKSFVNDYSQFPVHYEGRYISKNGKCYWLSNDFIHVLVFDLDQEKFREMDSPVPRVYQSDAEDNRKLWDVMFSELQCSGSGDNSLAVFVFEPNSVNISVLDKGEEWHWIRHVVTCIDRPMSDFSNPQVLSEFPISDASVVLRSGRSSFALYNPKKDKCVRFCHPSPIIATYCCVTVFNFKECLFALEGGVQVSDRVLEDFSTFHPLP